MTATKSLIIGASEKPDGILIITVRNNKRLLPKLIRPGVKSYTLDLCGGRRTTRTIRLKRARENYR